MGALLLSPVATELPETLNAVIWVRQGKVALVLGNISGAMMIQATIPSALGIFFTPWLLSRPLVWAGVVTMIAVATLLVLLRKHALSPTRLSLVACSTRYLQPASSCWEARWHSEIRLRNRLWRHVSLRVPYIPLS